MTRIETQFFLRGSNIGSRDSAVKGMHLSAPLCFLTFVKRVPKHLFNNYIHIRTSIETWRISDQKCEKTWTNMLRASSKETRFYFLTQRQFWVCCVCCGFLVFQTNQTQNMKHTHTLSLENTNSHFTNLTYFRSRVGRADLSKILTKDLSRPLLISTLSFVSLSLSLRAG